MKLNPILLSVVICTRDRRVLLDRCLRSLKAQKNKNFRFEIIVVDNSTRITTNTRFRHIRYIRYHSHNLSAVRNKGWRTAKGSYIVYLDDDAIATKDWILSIMDFIRKKPHIHVFGGPHTGFSDTPIPPWIPSSCYSLDYGTVERELHIGKEWLCTMNLVIRKKTLIQYRGFDESLVFPDGSFVYGEDTKLLMDLHNKGEKIFYVPSIRVLHFFSPVRFSLSWQLHKYFRIGRSIVYVHNRRDTIWYHVASFVDKMVRCMYWTVYPKSIPFKRRVFLALHGLFSWAGAFAVWIGIVPGCTGRSYGKNIGT